MTGAEYAVEVRTGGDASRAAMQAKRCARAWGLDETRAALVATATSELAHNVVKYGGGGVVRLRALQRRGHGGIEVEVVDQGPGIADLDDAMTDHVSTGGTLGLGLPGAKRMMDEFEIESELGRGVRVVCRKWS
jgi:serine/threonine-protein kinase RsbT